MDHNEFLLPTIVFEPPETSPDRRRRRRPRRVPSFLFNGDCGTDSTAEYSSPDSDIYSSSDDGRFDFSSSHQQRRHRRRHVHLPTGLLPGACNALLRRSAATATATPGTYGYRRLHYQGGQERRGRQQTRSSHCHANASRAGCLVRSPQRNILVRCGRWLFGDSRQCYCGRWACGRNCCAPATEHCGDERSLSRSPTTHREENYWGPGTQNWLFGPIDRNARDTPWSSGANAGFNAHNLAPGAVVEEIEEGGTLPTVSALKGRMHNHYYLGSNGHSRRSSRRRGLADHMRDQGVLSLANQERDRELDRNMVDRQITDREFERDITDRQTAMQRDRHLLALLDRERERGQNMAMVDCDMMKQRDNRLLTHLDRERGGARGERDVLELLNEELDRRRDVHPEDKSSNRSKESLKAREESSNESEGGLRAEIEALRNDFKKLMRSASKTRGAVKPQKIRREHSAVSSVMSRSSGRRKLPADIRCTTGRAIDNGYSDEEKDDEDDEAGDCSASSSRKVFEDGRIETGQVLRVPLPTDESSGS